MITNWLRKKIRKEKKPVEEPEKKKTKALPTKPDVFHQGREQGWPGPGGSRARRAGSWITRWKERE
jgi:hypothetical protein